MTLRVRLLSVALLFILVISLVGVSLIHFVGQSEIRQVDQQLESFLPTTKGVDEATSKNTGVPTLPALNAENLRFNTSHFSALYLAVISNSKRTVLSTPLNVGHAAPQLPETVSTSIKRVAITTVTSKSGSLSWRAVVVALPSAHTELLVAVPLNQVDATMRFLRLGLLSAGLIALAVLVAAGFWIVRLGLRPIAEVTEVAEAIVRGDRTRRVSVGDQRTEAGTLASAFNVMLNEQQDLEIRLRQFVADASHELRTPVSVIVGITELWRQGELRNGEQRDEAIHRIGVSGAQMGRLVEDLLLLARLDEGRPLEREPVDLGRVLREVVADALTTNPTRSISLDAPTSVVVRGDETSLRQVAVNLVMNATRHTPSDANIEVHVFERAGTVLLEVDDSGPGMSPEDASRAFDRFWQADPSRSRAGTGLGLAIVRSIVDAQQGEVSLESDEKTGTRVTVALPR